METDWDMSGNQSLPAKHYLVFLQSLIRKNGNVYEAPPTPDESRQMKTPHALYASQEHFWITNAACNSFALTSALLNDTAWQQVLPLSEGSGPEWVAGCLSGDLSCRIIHWAICSNEYIQNIVNTSTQFLICYQRERISHALQQSIWLQMLENILLQVLFWLFPLVWFTWFFIFC